MTERTPEGDNLKRCTICGFIVDTSYEAIKPTIDFTTRGRGKKRNVALDTALDELERVTALWREAGLDAKRCRVALEYIRKKAADRRNPAISFVADQALKGHRPIAVAR